MSNPVSLNINLECVHEEELKVGSFAEHPEVGCQREVCHQEVQTPAPNQILGPNTVKLIK